MTRLLVLIAASIGGAVGWWLGDRIGVMSAFVLSTIGTGVGVYAGSRIARQYLS